MGKVHSWHGPGLGIGPLSVSLFREVFSGCTPPNTTCPTRNTPPCLVRPINTPPISPRVIVRWLNSSRTTPKGRTTVSHWRARLPTRTKARWGRQYVSFSGTCCRRTSITSSRNLVPVHRKSSVSPLIPLPNILSIWAHDFSEIRGYLFCLFLSHIALSKVSSARGNEVRDPQECQ